MSLFRQLSFWIASWVAACGVAQETSQVFVTVADHEHFPMLIYTINSLQHWQKQSINEIAVYDLGLTVPERKVLDSLPRTRVYDIERVSEWLFQPFRTRPYRNGKPVKGWYAWKPVVLKQALDRWEEFLYIDAGITVGRSLDPVFAYMKRHGHFFITGGSGNRNYCTRACIEHFGLETPERRWVLESGQIDAAIQGITRSVRDVYVLPLYELVGDIRLFEDDGSCPNGFGFSRHDQTLTTILLRLSNLPTEPWGGVVVDLEDHRRSFVPADLFLKKPSWWYEYYE
ncbi:MAG: hypothetical protein ACOYKZ_06885 [Chlamydiia bacterium]